MERHEEIFEIPAPIGGYIWDIYSPEIPQRVIGYRIGRMAGEDEEDYREDFPEFEWYIQYGAAVTESSAPVSEIGVSIFLTQEEAVEAAKKIGFGGENMNYLKIGDIVRWYLNRYKYITGVVVEVCGDGTVWVEHSNGQQRHYKETELELET